MTKQHDDDDDRALERLLEWVRNNPRLFALAEVIARRLRSLDLSEAEYEQTLRLAFELTTPPGCRKALRRNATFLREVVMEGRRVRSVARTHGVMMWTVSRGVRQAAARLIKSYPLALDELETLRRDAEVMFQDDPEKQNWYREVTQLTPGELRALIDLLYGSK